MTGPRHRWFRPIALVMALGLMVAIGLAIAGYSGGFTFSDVWIRDMVRDLGIFGPLALVGLMVIAIVVSPIPSGPIAVAAGTLYGAAMGTVVSIVGAEIGALLAFSAARYLGYDAVRRSANPVMKFMAVPRSQLALMGIIFVSRLIPFISFDAISYAAGLTNLSLGRFAIATSLGIVPICWILATMGAGITTGSLNWMIVVLLGGGITLVPAIFVVIRTQLGR
jgi:uncharacterized membrane protein YdjX (TVP38/TMEM64 family)